MMGSIRLGTTTRALLSRQRVAFKQTTSALTCNNKQTNELLNLEIQFVLNQQLTITLIRDVCSDLLLGLYVKIEPSLQPM